MVLSELALVLMVVIAFAFVFYIFAGYPLIVYFLAKVLRRNIKKSGEYVPDVTIIIAAYNEEVCISETLENKLNLQYPAEKKEIIVVSDCSSDRTDEIVASFENQGVRLIRQRKRGGKTLAVNRAMKDAHGEIIMFSDANSIHASDCLKKLTANFYDPSVGYVTGKMIYVNAQGQPIGDGCSAYMKYENFLRSQESKIGSIVGVDGGVDAMRRDLYIPMRADQLPDFVQPLQVVRQGYRVVYEPEALLYEHSLNESNDEYRMRVRVALRAFWGLLDMRQLLLPFRRPLFSWQLWSHKILRYLTFAFLFIAYGANCFLLPFGTVYVFMFALQNLMYLNFFFTPQAGKIGLKSAILSFPYYFVLLNVASTSAFFKFLRGKRMVTWQPRKG
ncbi:MAG: glycosyltransferase family 2 protein [Fibrobacterota bacterium]